MEEVLDMEEREEVEVKGWFPFSEETEATQMADGSSIAKTAWERWHQVYELGYERIGHHNKKGKCYRNTLNVAARERNGPTSK